jgi:hypothetical protein
MIIEILRDVVTKTVTNYFTQRVNLEATWGKSSGLLRHAVSLVSLTAHIKQIPPQSRT